MNIELAQPSHEFGGEPGQVLLLEYKMKIRTSPKCHVDESAYNIVFSFCVNADITS